MNNHVTGIVNIITDGKARKKRTTRPIYRSIGKLMSLDNLEDLDGQQKAQEKKDQSADKSGSKWEKILNAEPREARDAILKAMEEDEANQEKEE